MAERAVADIDWARIDSMTDENIVRQVTGNSDAAPRPLGRAIRRCPVHRPAPSRPRIAAPIPAGLPSSSAFQWRGCAIGSMGGPSRTVIARDRDAVRRAAAADVVITEE